MKHQVVSSLCVCARPLTLQTRPAFYEWISWKAARSRSHCSASARVRMSVMMCLSPCSQAEEVSHRIEQRETANREKCSCCFTQNPSIVCDCSFLLCVEYAAEVIKGPVLFPFSGLYFSFEKLIHIWKLKKSIFCPLFTMSCKSAWF